MSESPSPLANLHIASPCHASWDAMTGDDKARFCKSCQKNVFNLSMMSRQEAERLIQSREGNLCVRYAQREDGTVITEDCPIGLEKAKLVIHRPWRLFVAGITGIVAALCGVFGISTSFAQPPLGTPTRNPMIKGDVATETKNSVQILRSEPAACPPALKTEPKVIMMGKPAMPIKQPVNQPIMQGGMAPPQPSSSTANPPQCKNPKAVVPVPQPQTKTVKVMGKISIKHTSTPKTKAPLKKAGKKAPLKKIVKKR